MLKRRLGRSDLEVSAMEFGRLPSEQMKKIDEIFERAPVLA